MKTRIVIEIDTTFKKLKAIDDDEDLTEYTEKEFHNSIFGIIETLLQSDEFEDEWKDYVGNSDDFEYLPLEDKDFSDYGSIKISISNKEE